MWILILTFSAIISTLLWYSRMPNDEYLFRYLSLILWGGTLMSFVDRLIAYFYGEPFIEITIEAVVIGIYLLIGGLMIWMIVLLIKDPRKVLFKKNHNY
ncbi:MAG: hypothetical protein QXI27_02310 [Nitrososphaerota archaeon]